MVMPITTHGYAKTPTYRCWVNMRQRCDNSNHPQYKDYGGRGITYDPEWGHFEIFLKDMGIRPSGLTLERKDNNQGYYKENCEWVTRWDQAQNRRSKPSNLPQGVSWVTLTRYAIGGRWRSYTNQKQGVEKRKTLYSGPDLFEAVCRRKSYENGEINA